MGELSGYWKDVSPIIKEENRQRREETFDLRLEYAKKQFELNNIPYKLCNASIGHFNLYFNNKVIMSFWSYTGKIKGEEDLRGIKACIRLYKKRIKGVTTK